VNSVLWLRAYNLASKEPHAGRDNVRAPTMAEIPPGVQFIKGGQLSMALIITHRRTFSTARSSHSYNPTVGRACAPIR
jgi:hypothetical protein